jgi:ferric-dicitrate binding protein FerR (iron transport regulator)
MAAALDRKESGKKKMVVGAIMAVAGIVGGNGWPKECPDDFFESDEATCNQKSGTAKLATAAGVAGVGVFAWGLYDYSAANSTISKLSAGSGATANVGLSPNQTVTLAIGRKVSVAYSVGW